MIYLVIIVCLVVIVFAVSKASNEQHSTNNASSINQTDNDHHAIKERFDLSQDNVKSQDSEDNIQSNPSADNFPQYDTLFELSKNNIKKVTFVSIDHSKKEKELIYVSDGQKTYFYLYPDAMNKYLFVERSSAIVSLYKKRSEEAALQKNVFNSSNPSLITKAFQDFPQISQANDAENEYLCNVENKLQTDRSILNSMILHDNRCPYTMNTQINCAYEWGIANYYNQSELVKGMTTIKKIAQSPYLARVDCGKTSKTLRTAYIGYTEIRGLVTSWANKAVGNAYYNAASLQQDGSCVVGLKRLYSIHDGKLLDYHDEINKDNESDTALINDSLLEKAIKENRLNDRIHEIAATLQSNQYTIITAPFDKNIIVKGCAGSGKTMILFHRLAYIAYNDSSFDPNNCFCISPTRWFIDSISSLVETLDLNKVHSLTYSGTIEYIINRYVQDYKLIRLKEYEANDQLISNNAGEFVMLFKEQHNDISRHYNYNYCNWVIKELNSILIKNNIKSSLPFNIREIKVKKLIEYVRGFDYNFEENIKREYHQYFNVTVQDDALKERLYINEEKSIWLEPQRQKNENGDGYVYIDPIIQTPGLLTWDKLKKKNPDEIKGLTDLYSALVKYINGEANPSILLISEYIFSEILTAIPDSLYPLLELSVLSNQLGQLEVKGNQKIMFFIDEYQNYSNYEVNLLKNIFTNSIFNFFGDENQKIIDEDSIQQSLSDYSTFEINENYRNAYEITEYINSKLNMTILPIGIKGSVKTLNFIHINQDSLEGKTAIITNLPIDSIPNIEIEDNHLINVVSKTNCIIPTKINLLTSSEARGMEFNTVYVNPTGMTYNEEYVAYTRALDNLYVIDNA